jgi:hypothetical protein
VTSSPPPIDEKSVVGKYLVDPATIPEEKPKVSETKSPERDPTMIQKKKTNVNFFT